MMSRTSRWTVAAIVLLTMTLAAAALLPVPFLRITAGPTFDVLGEVDGEPVLNVEGARTYPTSGQLDMTTVSEFGGVGGDVLLAQAVWSWLNPEETVEPRRGRYDENDDLEAEREQGRAVFDASASVALGAAANHLGRPVTSILAVSEVSADSPAAGKLEPGDELTSLAGQPVDGIDGLVGELEAVQPGSEVRVGFQRDGESRSAVITTAASPDDPGRAYLGVVLSEQYTSDFDIDIALEGIGGPSAGLVFALGIVDTMTPTPLVDGRHIAGTGTITGEGEVGAIGGITKKLIAASDAGAQLFLAPRDNCEEVAGAEPEGLTVAAVESLDEAVSVIQAWRSGDTEIPMCR